MKRLSLSTALGLASLAIAVAQPIPLYENFGVISDPPQIDALAFANYGTFSVTTTLPFDFQNTRNFTNTGTMTGAAGFQFDTATSTGPRRMAASFFNRTGASIVAVDSGGFILIINGQLFTSALVSPSFCLVSASNVVNHGLVSVGAGGQLHLEGNKLDLSRGGLEIRPIQGLGFTFVTPTNFIPDVGIYDQYWGPVTNDVIDSSAIVGGGGVVSPPHLVTNVNGFPFITQLALNSAFVSVYTNKISSTNWIVQAAFIGTSDPNVGVATRFARSSIFTNVYRSVVAEVSFVDTNVVTGVPQVQTLYFVDRLASDTNYTVLANLATFPNTYRPAVYDLTRTPPLEFFLGTPGNSAFDPDLIYNPSMSNTIVTNFYTAYSALIDPKPFILPPVEGLSITNQPGRVELVADELDMRGTRVRGNSFVTVSTKHLIGSSNAVVDAPDLSYSLASTNGNLQIQNLGKDTVNRFGGTMSAWSGLWTNQTGLIVTNIGPDPMDPTMTITNIATNVVDIGIHVLILDASLLQSVQSVLTHDFVCRSTNIVINDNLNIVERLLLDGQSCTLNGRLALSGTAQYWTSNTAPTLQYFTNNGTLSMGNAAFFGTDRSRPYSAIVNKGTMSGPSYSFRTTYFENSGTINPDARLTIEAQNAKFERGGTVAGNDVTISAGDVKLLGTRINTAAGFYLIVTNSLQDAGVTVSNVWDCQNGFNLLIKPRLGDLFGTTVQSTAPQFGLVSHTWAAEDRGAKVEGYQNNAVIGRLVLGGNPGSFLEFDATSPNGNALYVDFLDLEGPVLDAFNLDDLESVLGTGPGFVLYFADSNVPAEELDGALNGQVRWVRDFAGPNSSIDVLLLSGQTVKMNRALRRSATIDTDGDGVVNAFDFYPLDAAEWNGVPTVNGALGRVSLAKVGSSEAISISWKDVSQDTYTVEFATTLSTPTWQPLMNYTNVAVANGTITVLDTTWSASQSQRFYRLRNSR